MIYNCLIDLTAAYISYNKNIIILILIDFIGFLLERVLFFRYSLAFTIRSLANSVILDTLLLKVRLQDNVSVETKDKSARCGCFLHRIISFSRHA
ncbi:hypothetical protein [Dickeya dadantii]|uniref:hypothetical protein n=1 Tax=Dickeya dadantii TaxID=204038 RepID=UPI0021DACBD0|nr:hypothetical protein [Dickeya dadantii]